MNNFILIILFILSILPCYALDLKHIKYDQLRPSQKTLLIRDFKAFALEYETKRLKEKKYSYFLHFFHNFEAQAAHGDSCLFGGWPSTTDAGGLCFRPQIKNQNYSQYADKCGENELYCNPTLFGHNLCVPFDSSQARMSAFQNCDGEFKDIGRDLDTVAMETDANEFIDLAGSVEEVCNYSQQSVTGMCQALKYKMRNYIQDDTSLFIQNVISSKKSKNPEEVMNSIGEAHNRLEYLSNLINEDCADDELSEKQLIECSNYAKEFENLEKYTNELINHLETNDPKFLAQISCYGQGNTTLDEFTDDVVNAAGEVECTSTEVAHKKANCNRDLACAAASTFSTMIPVSALLPKNDCINVNDSCITNLIMGFAKNITDLLSGIWDLLGMAKDWVVDKAGDFWDWVTGVEDASSDKQLAAAGLSEDDVNALAEDPSAWYEKLWDGVKSSIDHFLKHNVGCQEWSGVPQYSECLKPFKGWECQSCKTYITGLCTAGGYILPEILMTITTGGLGNFIKSGAKAGAMVAKAAAKGGKLGKMAGTVAKNPLMKALINGGGKVVQAGKVVTGFAAKGFNTLKQGLKALGKTPGIKQTRDLISKINQKAKAAVNKTQAGKAYSKVERSLNDGLTNAGKSMERWAENTTGVSKGSSAATTSAGIVRNGVKIDDVVVANSKLDDAARMRQIEIEYPHLNQAQKDSIMDAHNKVPCPVYQCTQAQLKQKMDLMTKAGVPQDVASDAIRKGLAGNADNSLFTKADFKIDAMVDEKEEFYFTLKNSDDVAANTKAAEDYFNKIKGMEKMTEEADFTILSSSKRKIKDNSDWIDGYIERMEADGKIEKGTLDKLKNGQKQMQAEANAAKAVEVQNQKVLQDNFASEVKQYNQTKIDDVLEKTNANAYDDILTNSQKSLDELDQMKAKILEDAKAAGVSPGIAGDDAQILAQHALNRIEEAKRVAQTKINDVNRVLDNIGETADYSLSFNRQKALDIIAEDSFRASSFAREATEHLEDLKTIKKRLDAGKLKPNQVPGLANLDIDAEIKKFEDFIQEIAQ